MKRMLAAMLTALMLLTFLPLASPSAQAAVSAPVTFDVLCSVDHAYIGETVQWEITNLQGGTRPFEYGFIILKDGEVHAVYTDVPVPSVYFTFTSPGTYKAEGWVTDRSGNDIDYPSAEIVVTANPCRITRIEPLGATSLKLTWNKVPGAYKYHLLRSTDLKTWTQVRSTAKTTFSNTYLTPGTRYFYQVAFERHGVFNTAMGPVASGVPMAKTRITSLTSPSGRRIRLTWAKAAGASGYQVAMGTSANGSYKSVRIVTGGTTAIFSGVRSGSTLYFMVRPYRRVYAATYWGQYSAPKAVKVK
ncbi:MAG: fibronectin type III domain-containing protein [Bacillota bacterium]|nr:fibronectin type III domain-containing protein [Bacillota bacterium]